MTKIVINRCFGGFSISAEAARHIRAQGGCEHKEDDPDGEKRFYGYGHQDHGARVCPALIFAVEALGAGASDDCAKLKVVEIPAGVEWTVEEYDGLEWVAEEHRTWR